MGGDEVVRAEPTGMGLIPLLRTPWRASSSLPVCEDPKRSLHPEDGLYLATLIHGSQASSLRNGEKSMSVVYELPDWWYLVIATQTE